MSDNRPDEVHLIRVTVNGTAHELVVQARHSLADVLRHQLGCYGTHVGCEHGICGACTVLIDGVPARSCLVFGVQVDDCEVETVEGLADGPELNDLQRAFSEQHALQCGFCTPGFLMLVTGFLRANEEPATEQLRELVASNLCRCTGYEAIVEAVRTVAAGEVRSR